MPDIVDAKLWRQCKAMTAKLNKKPSVLPNRIGAMAGLTKDSGESVVISLVDPDLIKIKYDMDFSETTHEEKDPSYADGIWIDANADQKNITFFLYRSAHQYRDMCVDELSYDLARDRAKKGERELRLQEWRDQGRGL